MTLIVSNVPMLNIPKLVKPIEEELKQVLLSVLESGWYLLGNRTAEFEEAFSSWIEIPHCASCANGTDALVLALMALGIGKGDEVITCPNTAFPTACAISSVGAVPVFADIDPASWLIDNKRVIEKLSPRVKAVIPVHLYGYVSDVRSLREMLPEHIPIVEDCAQAHGALLNGKKVGSFGQLSAFSFYPTKNLFAFGDAGAVCTANKEIDECIRALRFYGQFEKNNHANYGTNSRMDEIQAAFLSVLIGKLDDWIARRREIAKRYRMGLSCSYFSLPCEMVDSNPAYHLFPVQVADRDGLKDYLNTKGIETAVHYPVPIHLQPAYKSLGHQKGDFPVAESLAKRILSLPIGPHLSDDQIEMVITSCNNFACRQ